MDWAEITGASSWNRLYDRYYRKQEMYQMQWTEHDVDLSKMKVSGAPFSGPLALIRDSSKISMVSASTVRNSLNIYSSAGGLLASIPWKKGKVVEMGWTEKVKLVVVLDDGSVLLYTVQGRLIQSISMGDEFKTDRVILACVWKSGVVCLSRNFSLVYVDDLAEPSPRRMPRLNEVESPPTCMAIIPPEHAASKGLEVLLAVGKTVLTVDIAGVQDQKLTAGPLRCMSVCPNGKMLACFTHDGFVWVITTDFSKNLSEFPTKSQVPPHQLVWCGTDSVVLYWDKMVLMVGPYGDWVKYSYDQPLWLLPEVDGVRIISNTQCEFLRRVPDALVDIFKIGSCSAGAMLVDALELLERNDGRAHDTIRAIRESDGLEAAVDTCLAAAAHEHNVELQQLLLKAAAYGASFIQMRSAVVMEKTMRQLRALNAVRSSSIGLPISKAQFEKMTAPALVLRLAQRGKHYLALQICSMLELDARPVVVDWACQRILTAGDMPDQELYQEINRRLEAMCELGHCRGCNPSAVSRAELAATALQEGRNELVTMLLDDEPNPADQVPLLMSLQDDHRALDKALASQDPDLIFLALLHLLKRHGAKEVFKVCMKDPTARGLMAAYASQQDEALFRQLCDACGTPLTLCAHLIPKAFKMPDLGRRNKALDAVKKIAAQSSEDNAKFLCKQIEDQCKLADAQGLEQRHAVSEHAERQAELERVTGKAIFLDTSCAQTVRQCFALNQYSKGLRLAKDLGMSEKLLWSLKVEGLAEGHDWNELEKLSKEKKVPPIGLEPFVEACLAHDRMDEAVRYADRLTDMTRKEGGFVSVVDGLGCAAVPAHELIKLFPHACLAEPWQAELCLRIGQFKKAAEAALASRDLDMLASIRHKCTNPADMALLDNMIAQSGLA